MNEIEKKIRNLGQKRCQEELTAYVESLSEEELIDLVQNKLNTPNFVYVFDYLMQSFTDTQSSHIKRFRVVLALLRKIENDNLSSTHSSSIITRLCIELPKFKPAYLIELCSFCVECIQQGRVSGMCWKEILPEVLNVIVVLPHVSHNDNDMTGLDYKNELITSLCMLVWSPEIITSLTSMFIDMPLTKEEHLQVVNRLGQQMEKLTCQEVPAFVYQLLKLCRFQNSQSIFLRLQHYFGIRIYAKLNLIQESDSENTALDEIGSAGDQEAIEVESTVLYHIYQSASVGHESIKDYLNSLKNLLKSPEFVLHPFQFTALLMISSIEALEERVIEILKSCISRAINEDHKKLESYWFREMVPTTCKIEDTLNQIIDCSLSDRHLVVQGLVQLAYTLLGVGSTLGRDGDLIAQRQWDLGKMIIFKVVKKKRQIASCIISSLSNRIVMGQNVLQYVECIHVLCQKISLTMLENQSSVIELVEYLVQVPGTIANRLFDAILPLIRLSCTIRDHLILLLRKALYSRVIETRKMAVAGFLKLIQTLKLSNLTALSQSSSSSSSGNSLLTQASLNCTGKNTTNVFSNEALCLEVLSILRRCFMQQAEVRIQLYEGLYDAVCMNPELGIPVLDVIWIHFNSLYVSDDNILPPLLLSKITSTKDLDVTLQEPLGKFIHCIGLILTKIKEQDDSNATVVKFTTAMESLCTRMTNCELIHFELDDGTDILDDLPESQQKRLVLKESMCIYEALITYKICSWSKSSDANGQQISRLFQNYTRLVDFSKNLLKPKKAEKKKKDATQQSQNTTRSEKSQKSKTFKMPNTVIDFQTACKLLNLLHKTAVPWATSTQANVIKTKPEFHRHVMHATIYLVTKLKKLRTTEMKHTKIYLNHLTEIGSILYERCIARLNAFIDFDSVTAVLSMECFHLILVVIGTHYRDKFHTFLNAVAGKDKDEQLVSVLQTLIDTYKALLDVEESAANSDAEMKKLSSITIDTITLLSSHIPTETNELSVEFVDWLKTVVNDTDCNNKQVLSSVVHLMFIMHIKFKNTVSVFETVAIRLSVIFGTINEENPDACEPQGIDEATAPNIFTLLCNSLKTMLDEIDWIINRLRSEYMMINYPGEDNTERKREYLKSKERGVCCQLCPLITIFGILANTSVPPGNLSEALLKITSHLYTTLNSLTKYFVLRSTKLNPIFQGARFEKVVRLAGKPLSTVVYDFIVYIEESQKQEIENTQRKKKPVDSNVMKTRVLRQTKSIPKLVFDLEQFGKSVIQLSNKTKIDLNKFIGTGTARDFRIKGLKEVLEKMDVDPNASNDADTTIEDVSVDNSINEKESEDEQAPPQKKARLKK